MKLSSKVKFGVATLAGTSVCVSGAQAVTGTFTVTFAFTETLSITETRAADFGEVVAGVATTYAMDSAGLVTPGPGGAAFGAPVSGQYHIADSAGTGDIHIVVNNPIPDAGVTITAFDCDFSGGVYVASGATCTINNAVNPGAAGLNLLVGFNISVDGTQVNNDTAHPTFDISVVYE